MLGNGIGVIARVAGVQRNRRVVMRAIEQRHHGVRIGEDVERVTGKVGEQIVLPCHVDRRERRVRRRRRGEGPAQLLDESPGEPRVEATIRAVQVGEHHKRHLRRIRAACGRVRQAPLRRRGDHRALGVAEDHRRVVLGRDRLADHIGSAQDRKVEVHVFGTGERPELRGGRHRDLGVVPAQRRLNVVVHGHIHPRRIHDMHVGAGHDQGAGGQ